MFTLTFACGCAFFKTADLGDSVKAAKERICLNSEGKGRFIYKDQKHIFSFQSRFIEKEALWKVYIDFPVYGRESIELEWNEALKTVDYDASYEAALLKNSRDLDPALLEAATKLWAAFFEDMLIHRNAADGAGKSPISWIVDRTSLEGSLDSGGFPAKILFLNPVSGGHFGRFDFKILSQEGDREFGMELIVRNCLESGK